MGGETRTDRHGNIEKGWDHDPPAKEKLVPFGILILATGGLTLLFGNHETSDFWGDCMRAWWIGVRSKKRVIKRLPYSLLLSLPQKSKMVWSFCVFGLKQLVSELLTRASAIV